MRPATPMSRTLSMLSLGVPFIVTLIVLGAALWRLRIWVDFFDESFHAALSYRYTLGDRPFVDEKTFLQPFAVLAYPFLKAFLTLNGSTDGMILFLRCFGLVVRVLVAGSLFLILKKYFRPGLALLVSLPCITFLVGGPLFCYYSLGAHCALLGSATAFHGVQSSRQKQWSLFSGILFGGAILGYQPLIFVAALCGVLVFVYSPKSQRVASFLWFLSGGILVGALFLAFVGIENLALIYEHMKLMGYSTPTFGFFKSVKHLAAVPYKYLHYALALLVLVSLVKRWKPALVAAMLIPFWAWFITYSFGYTANDFFFFTYFSLLGALLFVGLLKDPMSKLVFWFFWVPGIFSGTLYVWGNYWGGVANFGIGVLPAVFAACFFIFRYWEQEAPKLKSFSFVPFAALSLISSGYLVVRGLSPLGDGFALAQVTSGPYKNLITTQLQIDWLSQITQDLRNIETKDGNIFFHPQFPGGYLLTGMKPGTSYMWSTCWTEDGPLCQFAVKDHARHRAPHKVVIDMKELFFDMNAVNSLVQEPQNVVRQYILANHRLLLSRHGYDIYVSSLKWRGHEGGGYKTSAN